MAPSIRAAPTNPEASSLSSRTIQAVATPNADSDATTTAAVKGPTIVWAQIRRMKAPALTPKPVSARAAQVELGGITDGPSISRDRGKARAVVTANWTVVKGITGWWRAYLARAMMWNAKEMAHPRVSRSPGSKLKSDVPVSKISPANEAAAAPAPPARGMTGEGGGKERGYHHIEPGDQRRV